MKGNTVLMKEVNTNIILQQLKLMRKATKLELSQKTGLSIVTVNSILQQLLKAGEVAEDEVLPSGGGRPALSYSFNEAYRHGLAIYIRSLDGKVCLTVKVINLLGECVSNREYYLDEVYMHSFEPMVEEALLRYPNIGGIGFALPGVERDGVIAINDYKNMNGLEFTKYYREKYGIPVVMENDVNAVTVGYCSEHQRASDASVVCIYFPEKYSPGAGMMLHNELYKGKWNFAGEISNIPLGFDWKDVDYQNTEESVEKIGKLIVAVSCVVAPEQVVLYGDFLNQEWMTGLEEVCGSMMQGIFMPQIIMAHDFEEDYAKGIIRCTLELMEDILVLSKKGRMD